MAEKRQNRLEELKGSQTWEAWGETTPLSRDYTKIVGDGIQLASTIG
jgi:hypothetical protein